VTTVPVAQPRPRLRGWLHLAAAVGVVPAAITLLVRSRGAGAVAAVSIYAAALLTMFLTSGVYHRLDLASTLRPLMQRLDHCGIYVLILGTYVPFCLLALPSAWGIPLLSVVGAGSILGIALKLGAFRASRVIGHILYVALGWAAIVAAPALVNHLGAAQLALLLGGGVAYTLGLPVLLARRPDPWPRTFGYHEVWHAFTVVGASLHYVAIAFLLH
jgi:hemolysin III